MNATTVAVDLAKNVFELALADAQWKVLERARLSRAQFERWFDNRKVDLVVMEACGSAHHWARLFKAHGIEKCACCRHSTWRMPLRVAPVRRYREVAAEMAPCQRDSLNSRVTFCQPVAKSLKH